ncbi:hypothetical protein F4679DRAFT_520666 [Xylaria curta]|nr:hypothetical protein F4679DRAFT_520666 [Xylaria curta]
MVIVFPAMAMAVARWLIVLILDDAVVVGNFPSASIHVRLTTSLTANSGRGAGMRGSRGLYRAASGRVFYREIQGQAIC